MRLSVARRLSAPRARLLRSAATKRPVAAQLRLPWKPILGSWSTGQCSCSGTGLAFLRPARELVGGIRPAGSGSGEGTSRCRPAHSVRCTASSSSSPSSTATSTSTPTVTGTEVRSAWAGLSEEEVLRRQRISEANKGKQPWNKGRKHSEATKAKIRARTREAMQRPEVLQKLRNMPHPKHNERIRRKISDSLKVFYAAKRPSPEERKAVAAKKAAERAAKAQAKAEERAAAKIRAKEKAAAKRAASAKAAKTDRAEKAAKPVKRASTATRSAEHKRKIADAIRRKWQDPTYRTKILTRMSSEEVQERRMKNYRKSVAKNNEINLRRMEMQRLAEQRALMKSTAAQLVAKGERTVRKLEEKVEALHAHPTVQMRAQTALANARGVLKKAQVQMAQIEMELSLASEMDGYAHDDEAEAEEGVFDDDSINEDEEVGSKVASDGEPGIEGGSSVNGVRLNGGRPRNLGGNSVAMNGHKLEAQWGRQELQGRETNGYNGTHNSGPPWMGAPQVDGRRVEAAMHSLDAHPQNTNGMPQVSNGRVGGRGGGDKGGIANGPDSTGGVEEAARAGRGGSTGRDTRNGSRLIRRHEPTEGVDDV